MQILLGHNHGLAIQRIELARIFEKRFIAACVHALQNRPHHFLGLGEPGFAAGEQAGHGDRR